MIKDNVYFKGLLDGLQIMVVKHDELVYDGDIQQSFRLKDD